MSDTRYISDHAVLRFIERVHGVDVDAIRRHMDKPGLREAVVVMRASKVRIDGLEFYCRNGVVKTIWNKEEHGQLRRNRGLKNPNKKRMNKKRQPGGSHRSKKR